MWCGQLRSFGDNLTVDNFRFCRIVGTFQGWASHLNYYCLVQSMTRYLDDKKYYLLHDRPVTICDPWSRDCSSYTRSPCFIRTNGHDGYDPSPTILAGLKMTDKQLHHLHTWQLARAHFHRHARRQTAECWTGTYKKWQLLLSRDTSRD